MTDSINCDDQYMVSKKSKRASVRQFFQGGALVLMVGITRVMAEMLVLI